ncbi:hypothetical protein GQ54DRAFT_298908 [Martensiomyces pterosporus]|nr:hypothetical protein GQ54DRAFT_298908 [Martensiomyces pterosporus]
MVSSKHLGVLSLLLLGSTVCADTYPKSPCNAVHWTHMLEGKIIIEGREARPIDIENLVFYEHDMPPNHRIIHVYDDEVLDRHPDRLSVYVDRENIFVSAYCS